MGSDLIRGGTYGELTFALKCFGAVASLGMLLIVLAVVLGLRRLAVPACAAGALGCNTLALFWSDIGASAVSTAYSVVTILLVLYGLVLVPTAGTGRHRR